MDYESCFWTGLILGFVVGGLLMFFVGYGIRRERRI